MRVQLLLIAVFLIGRITVAKPSSDATASIVGAVSGTEPRLVVYLQPGKKDPMRYYDGYQVETNKDARFSFDEIKPGTYRLRAEAMGSMNAGRDGDKGIAHGCEHGGPVVERGVDSSPAVADGIVLCRLA